MKRLVAGLFAFLSLSAAPPPETVPMKVLLAEKPAPKLSDYRLFQDGRPIAELTPYALNTPLFSDYAEKFRYLYLPPGMKTKYRPDGVLDFPVGATLVKTFAYPADFRRPDENVRWIETRLLIRKRAGWTAQTYVWNADRSEAVLKRAGTRLDVSFVNAQGRTRQVDYAVPNANQCKECHQLAKVLVPIGPKARNLNGDFAYADGRENQLAHWTRLGLLTGAPAPAAAPRAARWDDPAEPLEARARAYLDANCAHCHNAKGSASNSGLVLTLEETRPTALGIGKDPVAAGRGSGGFDVGIKPGDPDASILVFRMASTEPGVMMPELSRSLTHDEGLALIRAWIKSLRTMSLTRRAVLAGAAALTAGPVSAAPSAVDVQTWNAYRERLEARLADAGGGAFEAADGRAALEATNKARAAAGVRPLAWHAGLALSARAHAADLLARGYVEHLSPEGFDPSHRFWLLERRTVGSPSENIAYHRSGQPPSVEHLVAEWRKSPPHWRNMLGERHTRAGFAVVRKGSRAYLVGTYAAPLARLSSPLPFRIRDFDEARTAIKGWDDLPPTLRPRVGAPQGAGAGAAQGPPPWLMQLGLRRQIDERSFELIGGPIFVMGA